MFFVASKESSSKLCWGYEENCDSDNQFSRPYCIHHQKAWYVLKLVLKHEVDLHYMYVVYDY